MTQLVEYIPSAGEIVSCLTSEYPWLNLIKNQGKKYDPILDYLIILGKEKESQDLMYDSKKYQSKVISEITGIKISNIKKLLLEAYNDILVLNSSNPKLFCNTGKYLYRFSFRYRWHYYSFFHLWLDVPLNLFECFDFPFIYAKINCGYFWIENIGHEHEYGKSITTVNLNGGYPNLYRSLLLAKAQFTNEITFDDMINLSEYRIDEKLKKYAQEQNL